MTWRIFKNRLKKAYKSWTIIFNAVIAPSLWALQQYSSVWVDYFGESSGPLIGLIIAVNGAIRFKTTSDLADK